MKKILFASCIAMSLLASCDKEDRDNKAPVLTVTRTNPVVTSAEICNTMENNVIKVRQGQSFTIAFTIEDNFEVEQYRVDLHDNTDCHDHGRSSSASSWHISEIREVDAQRIDLTKTYTVPADATPGAYHLEISALDDNGNESTENIYYNILVEEPTPAQDITPPSISIAIEEVLVTLGGTFSAAVTAGDNVALDGAVLNVDFTTMTGTAIATQVYSTELQTTATSTTFNVTLPILTTYPTGMYRVTFVLIDAAGNSVSMEKVFTVN